jgi:hypothetical protein
MPQSNRQHGTRGPEDRSSQPGRGGTASAQTEPREAPREGGTSEPGEGGGGPTSMMAGARDRIESFGTAAGHTIQEYPMVSVLAGFGIGFAVGFAFARLVAPEEESWTSRARDSMTDMFHDLRRTLRDLPHATAESIATAFRR